MGCNENPLNRFRKEHMSEKQEFEHESVQDNQTVSQYLKALIEGFESGKVVFISEKRQLVMQPNNLLEFSIKARRKGEKSKIVLKFSWKDTHAAPESPGRLKIIP
jgi:amphi-Trp domain-containing protein